MITLQKSSSELNFEGKPLAELRNAASLLQASQNEFSQSISAANLKIQQTQEELKEKERAIQFERSTIQRLQAIATNQTKKRTKLLSELEALQQRLANMDQDLATKDKEISNAQEQVKTMEADVTSMNELVKKDQTDLSQLILAQEDVVSIIAKVQAAIEVKSAPQILSSEQLIAKHQLLMNMLLKEPSPQEASSEFPLVVPNVRQTHISSSSASDVATDETTTSCSLTHLLVHMKRSLSPEDQKQNNPAKRQVVSLTKLEDLQSSEDDTQNTKAVLKNLAPQIRAIFRKVHADAKNTSRDEKIKCYRNKDGIWIVPEKVREAFGIIGIQAKRSPEQAFYVRIRNQVISQKLLDTGLTNDEQNVEAFFEDPRDATEAYYLIFNLLK